MYWRITNPFKYACSRASIIHQFPLCHSLTRMASNYWVSEEIIIPHPYGHFAAKAWGNKSNHPVLALHGYQDNAGSFDRIIPLLSPTMYIVAIDTAGHGYSSHKPRGHYYTFMEHMIELKHVVSYLKWDKFSIIGHSMGGCIGMLFASVFPEQVLNAVSFDMIKPFSRPNDVLPSITRSSIERILNYESQVDKSNPVYTMEEAKKRIIEGLFNEVTPESAEVLMKRGVRKSDCGTGVVFTRDYRLKYYDYRTMFSHDMLKAFMSKMACNLLIVSASDSVYKSSSPEMIDPFLEIYEKHCKSFTHVTVNGSHYVHLNDPHVVAPYINHFFNAHLNEPKSKL